MSRAAYAAPPRRLAPCRSQRAMQRLSSHSFRTVSRDNRQVLRRDTPPGPRQRHWPSAQRSAAVRRPAPHPRHIEPEYGAAASIPSMSGMCISISTRSNPCPVLERVLGSCYRLAAVQRVHHGGARLLKHRAREQRVDVVVLGEQDRKPGRGARTRPGRVGPFEPGHGLPRSLARCEELRERRYRPDRAYEIGAETLRAQAPHMSSRSPGSMVTTARGAGRSGARARNGRSRRAPLWAFAVSVSSAV